MVMMIVMFDGDGDGGDGNMMMVTVTCQGGAPAVSCPQLSVAGADFADCNGEYRWVSCIVIVIVIVMFL